MGQERFAARPAGDMNIAPEASIDRAMYVYDPKQAAGTDEMTPTAWLRDLCIKGGGPFHDAFRLHHPDRWVFNPHNRA